MDIEIGTIEERIIKTLQENYPITVAELSKKLNMPEEKILFELNKLQSRGIVVLEPLPDKIFVRLIRFDIRFIGRRRQYKFIKKKKMKFKEEKEDSKDDIMYS
ncbi:MAG: winged helix-turn-helix domain-containing protein [Thermoplasmatales archaeon]|nr:winged helix-turn-helix domain-containing protein [Thermoplasmatales archaeon]